MNNGRNGNDTESNRRTYEPRRFKSLVAELHREAQQRRARPDNQAPHEAPLVRVTKWLVVATIALAVASFLGFGAAILQWLALRSSDEAIGEQAKSMEQQFSMAEAQLRPQLSLSIERSGNLRNTSTFEKVNGSYFTPVWKNSGAVAPAEMIGWSHIRFFPGYSVGFVPDPFHLGQEGAPLTPLLPDSSNSYQQSSEFFEAKDLHQVHTRTVQLVAWGYIQYRDPFPGSPVHHINWCQKLLYLQTPKGPATTWMPHSPDCNHED